MRLHACLQAGGESCQVVTAAGIIVAPQEPEEQGPNDESQGGPYVQSLDDKQHAVCTSMLELARPQQAKNRAGGRQRKQRAKQMHQAESLSPAGPSTVARQTLHAQATPVEGVLRGSRAARKYSVCARQVGWAAATCYLGSVGAETSRCGGSQHQWWGQPCRECSLPQQER